MANRIRAAWAFLLGCYEQSEDVVFGVTNGGRYEAVPQCADIVGPAIATSPMRVRLNRESTVAEFLQKISMQVVSINAFEQTGLANIQQLGQDGVRACSFRTLVNVQVTDAGRGSNLLTPVEPDKVEPLDYALVLEPFVLGGGSKLRLRLSYDSLVIRHEKVIQVAAQLKKALRLFTTHPNKKISAIERLPIDSPSSLASGPSVPPGKVPKPFQLISSPAHEIRKHAAVECGVSEDIVHDVYPCTPAQNRMVMASLRYPTAYKSHVVFTPPENQNDTDILHAWNALYRQMPVLRTRFFHSPMEVTSSKNDRELRMLQAVVDEPIQWSEWGDVQECLSADHGLIFSSGQPLSRFALIRNQPGGGIRQLVLTTHHSIFEPSITQRMLRFLQEITDENTHDLETTPFTLWAEAALQSLKEPSKIFWAQALKNCQAPSFPKVPATHAPLTTDTMHTTIALPAIESGIESPAPSKTLLQLAWALTLSQYYDSNDVVFGIAVQGAHGDRRNVMGPTFSVVPQRIVFEHPDMRMNDLIRMFEERTEELLDHAQYDISMIREIDDSCATACEFQNLLVLKTTPDDNGTSPLYGTFRKAAVSTVAGKVVAGASTHIHNFALAVEVAPLGNEVSVRMSYDPFVLKAVQVRRLMSHYESIIRQMSTFDHSRTVSGIHHVPDDHLAEILSWNAVLAPRVSCVHELFEAQVQSQPSSPAVCARDGEWTFSQLDNAAERLARFLRSMGVGPGSYVPLLFEKCGLAIIAMLAILKAGGSSVALDPGHPKDRLQGLINGMGKCTILCSRENHILAAQVAQRAIVLDEQTLSTLSKQPLQRRLSDEEPVSAQSTAFVLFTSGSTGMPKGILIPHQAFSSSIRGHSEVLRFSTGPGSRNFQFTAYTSDVSIGEIFTSLAVGSCVCVPSDWDRKNNIAGAIRDLNVNWAFFTPSVATLLVPSEVPGLRTMVFGGETASPENFQTWAPALHLINSFGPAECSIWTHCIPRKVTLDDFGSNIGFGVGCATWITDPTDHHRLLPIGAVGEMLVEGPNVAAGYLNDPVKTNATFVHDPAWMPPDRGSMRLYRSGDLARYLPNGMVQFLGRRDHQVKLRGLRIELGEIEHQIREHFSDGNMLVAVDIVNPRPVGSPPILAAFIASKEPEVLPEDQEGVLNLLADKSDQICQTLHA
ncbi:AMP-dependent synthetase/ligase [Penicillium expansum]|nr:AMP-dependent synthetase/ligase [Penicillium expansum]